MPKGRRGLTLHRCTKCGTPDPQAFRYNRYNNTVRQIQPCISCRKRLYYKYEHRERPKTYQRRRPNNDRDKFDSSDRYILLHDPDDSMPVGASLSQSDMDLDLSHNNYLDGTVFQRGNRKLVVEGSELRATQ